MSAVWYSRPVGEVDKRLASLRAVEAQTPMTRPTSRPGRFVFFPLPVSLASIELYFRLFYKGLAKDDGERGAVGEGGGVEVSGMPTKYECRCVYPI